MHVKNWRLREAYETALQTGSEVSDFPAALQLCEKYQHILNRRVSTLSEGFGQDTALVLEQIDGCIFHRGP